MSSLVNQAEISELAARFGTPILWTRTLDVTAASLEERRQKYAKRQGEVVFAMPRPDHTVLLHYKSFYPPGCFRLLSGGVNVGERVPAAAEREISEETGLETELARLLGIVEYDFRHDRDHVGFVSYVFLTGMTTGVPYAQDTNEQIAEFRQVAWIELARVAEQLEDLPGDWHDWGNFRAIPHRLVITAIQDQHLEL